MKMIEDSFVRFCVWINGPLINTVTLHLRLWNKADCVNHCDFAKIVTGVFDSVICSIIR